MYSPSNLRDMIALVSSNYLKVKQESFAEHPLADLLRKKPQEIISRYIDFEGISIVGSPGKGQWTHYPWIAVINKT